jgi:hypothetical protein
MIQSSSCPLVQIEHSNERSTLTGFDASQRAFVRPVGVCSSSITWAGPAMTVGDRVDDPPRWTAQRLLLSRSPAATSLGRPNRARRAGVSIQQETGLRDRDHHLTHGGAQLAVENPTNRTRSSTLWPALGQRPTEGRCPQSVRNATKLTRESMNRGFQWHK